MKKTLMLLGLGAILAQASFASSIGVGYGVADPIFKNDEKGYFLPFVDYEYNGFFVEGGSASGLSFGYKLFEADNYKFTVYGIPFGGYKVEAGDMDPGYKGIDDRDTQFMGGAELSYTFLPYEITSEIAIEYGKEGGTASFTLKKPYYVTSKLTLVPSVNYTFYNEDFADYYFGVTPNEAGRKANYNIGSAYDGKAGSSYGVGVLGDYRFSNNMSFVGFAGVTKLSDDLSNSPIVDNDVISIFGGGVVYSF